MFCNVYILWDNQGSLLVATAWKACMRVTVSRVRIPSFPPKNVEIRSKTSCHSNTTFLRNWSDSGNLPQSFHNRKEKVWLLYAKKVVFGRYKSALKKGQSQDALLRNLMLQIGGLRQKQQLDKVCMSITQD